MKVKTKLVEAVNAKKTTVFSERMKSEGVR